MTSAKGAVPFSTWPGNERSPGLKALRSLSLDRVDPEGNGELVHLGLVGKAHLHRAEAPHCPAGRVVGPDRERLDERVRHPVGSGRHAGGVHDVTAVEVDR